MYKKYLLFGKTLLLVQLFFSSIILSQNGTIKGTITDFQTKQPLSYSTAVLVGTSLGSAADTKGNFLIKNVPAGKYKLKISFIGYQQEELSVTIQAGETIEKKVALKPEALEGRTVIITAQAEGQLKAINEQLNSNTIKNVVSATKIQELPDVNAAESVSRLPGVSLIRTGGEGSKVVVRGLSPQYNSVTIDGVELPANVTSSDPNDHKSELRETDQLSVAGDRATDLSMISSNMLGGIEVIKAITPDMDANVLGGVINFTMRKADESKGGKPGFEFLTQGSYNNLKNTYKDYKLVATYEQRYISNKLGLFLEGSKENRNLSSNQLNSEYNFKGLLKTTEIGDPEFNSMTLNDIIRKRERYGATAVIDYNFESGSIGFMNFFSRSNTNSDSRSEKYMLEADDLFNEGLHSKSVLDVYSNLLSYKQTLGILNIDARLSHSYSEGNTPNDVNFRFWQDHAGLQGMYSSLRYKSPKEIASHIRYDPENSDLFEIFNVSSVSKDRTFNAGLDLSSDLTLTDKLSGKLKIGGAFQYRNRSYNYEQNSGSLIYDEGTQVTAAIMRAYPQFGTSISYADFIDPNFSYGNFLKGEYSMRNPLNMGLMLDVINVANSHQGVGDGGGYKKRILPSVKDDYDGNEKRSSFYGMATFNIGQMFSIIPGLRYQNLTTTYSGIRGEVNPGNTAGFLYFKTEKTVSHGYYLPMLHFRITPLEWMQIHLAYTNTLNYPDYNAIIPKYYIGTNYVEYNNYNLKPARSENLDAMISCYANEIGLFAIGGFRKSIKDIIFAQKTYPKDFSEYPDLYEKLKDRKESYTLFTYINNPIKIDIYGLEAEWQTNFWYLPGPLSGIVLNVNYTHIFSEAKYPKSITMSYLDSNFIQQTYHIDTTYAARLLNQPNDIVNIALGYDYADFSLRTSMLYQDNIFKKPDFWLQNRVHSSKYVRFDLSVKQKLPWYGLQVYFNLNNLNGEDDIDINQKTKYTILQQRYGMTADVGIRLDL